MIKVPIICEFKKTVIEVSSTVISFENTIIGEETVKKLILKNTGGLGTSFEIRLKSGKSFDS